MAGKAGYGGNISAESITCGSDCGSMMDAESSIHMKRERGNVLYRKKQAAIGTDRL